MSEQDPAATPADTPETAPAPEAAPTETTDGAQPEAAATTATPPEPENSPEADLAAARAAVPEADEDKVQAVLKSIAEQILADPSADGVALSLGVLIGKVSDLQHAIASTWPAPQNELPLSFVKIVKDWIADNYPPPSA